MERHNVWMTYDTSNIWQQVIMCLTSLHWKVQKYKPTYNTVEPTGIQEYWNQEEYDGLHALVERQRRNK
jgi:hypothetical protein